jgi:cell division septation protein DedD
MKFIMSEQLKQRLAGSAAILALALVIVPSIMKTANQKFAESEVVAPKLPSKPLAPEVAMPSRDALFESVRVVQLRVPDNKFTDIVTNSHANQDLVVKKSAPTAVKISSTTKDLSIIKPIMQNKLSKDLYSVQLGAFSEKNNANLLVQKLRKQGFSASIIKVNFKHGVQYKVMVGSLKEIEAALDLRKALVKKMRLSGMVVKSKLG